MNSLEIQKNENKERTDEAITRQKDLFIQIGKGLAEADIPSEGGNLDEIKQLKVKLVDSQKNFDRVSFILAELKRKKEAIDSIEKEIKANVVKLRPDYEPIGNATYNWYKQNPIDSLSEQCEPIKLLDLEIQNLEQGMQVEETRKKKSFIEKISFKTQAVFSKVGLNTKKSALRKKFQEFGAFLVEDSSLLEHCAYEEVIEAAKNYFTLYPVIKADRMSLKESKEEQESLEKELESLAQTKKGSAFQETLKDDMLRLQKELDEKYRLLGMNFDLEQEVVPANMEDIVSSLKSIRQRLIDLTERKEQILAAMKAKTLEIELDDNKKQADALDVEIKEKQKKLKELKKQIKEKNGEIELLKEEAKDILGQNESGSKEKSESKSKTKSKGKPESKEKPGSKDKLDPKERLETKGKTKSKDTSEPKEELGSKDKSEPKEQPKSEDNREPKDNQESKDAVQEKNNEEKR